MVMNILTLKLINLHIIKTLTTLLLATPKTDIIQAVGRILRTKHTRPLVIDIVDSHDIFQKQFLKRKQYYKKQNYEMMQTTAEDYIKGDTVWKQVLSKPKKKCLVAKKGLD